MPDSQKDLHKKLLGKKGEALAAKYLKKRGYKLLAKNYRTPFGEADLIFSHGEQTVFVEVKTPRATDSQLDDDVFRNFPRRQQIVGIVTHHLNVAGQVLFLETFCGVERHIPYHIGDFTLRFYFYAFRTEAFEKRILRLKIGNAVPETMGMPGFGRHAVSGRDSPRIRRFIAKIGFDIVKDDVSDSAQVTQLERMGPLGIGQPFPMSIHGKVFGMCFGKAFSQIQLVQPVAIGTRQG